MTVNAKTTNDGLRVELGGADLSALERDSWIDSVTAAAFKLRRVSSGEGAQLVGRDGREDCSGLIFPVYWPGQNTPREYFLRRDHPSMEQHNDKLKPKGKYLAPPGRGNLLLFGPGESLDVLTDSTVPIVLVEGLKKLLAGWRLARYGAETPRFLVAGLSGAWNWRGTVGKTTDASGARVDVKGSIPDFDKITWTQRRVLVVFDSDAATNSSVHVARLGLADDLLKRGAIVAVPDLPQIDGLEKTGLDDLLAAWGPDKAFSWLATVQKAAPAETEMEVGRLAKLPPIEYGKHRKGAAKKFGVPVSFLDEAVNGKRREQAEQDVGPILETIEPAAESVDGAALADDLVRILRRFIVLDDHNLHAVVLWIFWSYAFELWGIAPMLAFLSPEKRCGKTSLLSLLANLLDRALLASNVSAAAIFRVIESSKPTLIVDEMDTFTDADEALRGILNCGHTKAGAKVIRVQGESFVVKVFSTWCPKVLAAIGALPDTIVDRSIVIPMKRRLPGESIAKLRWAGRDGRTLHEDLRRLAGQCKRWVTDHADALTAATPGLPDTLNDRAADNWYPLFSIAAVLGGAWPERAAAAALLLSGGDLTESDSIRAQLLRDIQTVICDLADAGSVWSQDLVDRLVLLEERPWGEWRHGKPMSSSQLARQLRPFGVLSRDIKWGGQVKKGYLFCDLSDACARYLCPPPQENQVSNRYRATSLSGSGDSSLFQSATLGAGSGLENTRNPALGAESSAVADQNLEIGPGKGKVAGLLPSNGDEGEVISLVD
jgi:hypothetical protein